MNVVILGIVQGLAELLPVSSSAHVVVTEKLLGLDPSSPPMTLLLVMLHTGTMFAVILYFWRSWRSSYFRSVTAFTRFAVLIVLATALTGVIGGGAALLMEHTLLRGVPHAHVEDLFNHLELIAPALAAVGVLIIVAGLVERRRGRQLASQGASQLAADRAAGRTPAGLEAGSASGAHARVEWLAAGAPTLASAAMPASAPPFMRPAPDALAGMAPAAAHVSVDATAPELSLRQAGIIGVVQGLSLPFRGFSRSGATISTGMLLGAAKVRAEVFSFALAVVLTPPVVVREALRLAHAGAASGTPLADIAARTLLGALVAFLAGLAALRWLSGWLERGRWHLFGIYCLVAAAAVGVLHHLGY